MKGQCPSTARERLKRFVATFLLVLLLPAAVLAAPLRHCLGQDGHRAIEFVHWKGVSHAVTEIDDIAALEGLSRDPHVTNPNCQDRLLLPVAAKRDFCSPRQLGGDPPVAHDFCFHASPSALRHQASPCTPPNLPRPDPRLATLRTVELLN